MRHDRFEDWLEEVQFLRLRYGAEGLGVEGGLLSVGREMGFLLLTTIEGGGEGVVVGLAFGRFWLHLEQPT